MTTRDEMLAMAEQAGFTPLKDEWVFMEMLERFHALAVAPYKEDAERYRWIGANFDSFLAILAEQNIGYEIEVAIDRARSAK